MGRYYSRYAPIAYTYHADIYCYDCGKNLPDIDPEGNDKNVIAPWEEVGQIDPDTGLLEACHCGECGEVIE